MRKLLIPIAAALALGVAGNAFAADLRPGPVVKAVPVVTPWTWSGFWLGVNGGAALTKTDVHSVDLAALGLPSTGSFHNNGLLLGGEIDARYQGAGSSLVFGLDAIFDWANTKGGDGGCFAIVVNCTTKNSWFGFVGTEIGISSIGGQTALPFNPANLQPIAVPVGNVKVSALSGVAFRDFQMTTSIPLGSISGGTERHTVAGFAVGGALDIAVTPNLSAGVRYIHPFWKQNSCSGALTATMGGKSGLDCSFKDNEDIFLLNLSYKLPYFGASQPLSVRY